MQPICKSATDDMVFFHIKFPKTYSFIRSITVKKYQSVADASLFHNIEQTLNETDSSIMSAQQLVQTHYDYFSSLSSKLCNEIDKDIIIRGTLNGIMPLQ